MGAAYTANLASFLVKPARPVLVRVPLIGQPRPAARLCFCGSLCPEPLAAAN